jgi:hypothetical protein
MNSKDALNCFSLFLCSADWLGLTKPTWLEAHIFILSWYRFLCHQWGYFDDCASDVPNG